MFTTAILRKGVGSMTDQKVHSPFWTIVRKEIADHVRSLRFIILVSIIVLTCAGSLYTALTNIAAAIKPDDPDSSFLFLKLFTVSDGTLPSFVFFINFLGPLLGIALGFDAVNSEQNKGTLSRMLSQPIHRDCIINAKFVAALIVIGVLLFALGFLVMGCGLIAIGIPPTPGEFWRIILYIITGIFYVAFWLTVAILFSLCFRQAATSALASIAVWLFFSVFYAMIVSVVARALSPSEMAPVYHQLPAVYPGADAAGAERTVQRCHFDAAHAFGAEPRPPDDGAIGRGYSQSAASGREHQGRVGAVDRTDCRDRRLLCRFLLDIHAAGNPFPIGRKTGVGEGG